MLFWGATLPTMWPEEFPPKGPCKDSFVADNDESIPKQEWMPGPQKGRQEQFQKIILVPSSINLSTPPRPPSNGHFTHRVIIRPMKDDDGKRTFELGQIVTMSCHPWDSKAKLKQNPKNPLQQDSPVPCIPCKQTLQQPTPGSSGTQWSEDLFWEPSQHNEPPIPGSSQPSEPHEDASACEHEPEVAPMQSTEEPFGKSPLHIFTLLNLYSPLLHPSPACHTTPTPIIIIDNTPIGSPLPVSSNCLLPPVPSSLHSHDEAQQELTDWQPTLMIPQAIVNKSID
ncbi:hypothetical protein O181_017791 [Austropuccinia psidii MF-1]|uniref:Uncharacterized protein n=1 Tax=Austropuccinia psidii MF-1 TaxID=1389203 RepID=A0A9Q3GSB2_9BASI|nr:hypothetical protein [Austropuccinia psidii MF-1]